MGKKQEKGVQRLLVAASSYERSIDWESSSVIPLTGECLYVNKAAVSSSEKLISTLIEDIVSIKSPEGGLIVERVVNGNQLYQKDSAPDVIILPRNIEIYNAPLLKLLWTTPSPDRWTGKHALYGILIAYGPTIKKGRQITGATLYDIVPTILELFRVPIPGDLDGTVLRQIFKSF